MSKIIKVLAWMVTAAVVGSLLWIGLRTVGRHFNAILFFSYALVSLLIFVVLFISNYRVAIQAKAREGADQVVVIAAVMMAKSKSFGRTRILATSFINTLHTALFFPWLIVQHLRFKEHVSESSGAGILIRSAAVGTLDGGQVYHDVVALVLLIWAAAVYHHDSLSPYASIWAIVVIAGIVTQMIGTFVSGRSLPETFRAQLGNPYLQFVGMALSYGVFLLAGYCIIRSQAQQVPINLELITATAISLFKLGSVSELVKQVSTARTLDILIAASALIYYSTILSSVLRWKDFSRTGENYAAIASNLVVLGRYNEALRWSSKCSPPSFASYMAQGMALISMNHLEDGLEVIRKAGYLNEDAMSNAPHLSAILAAPTFLLPRRVVSKVLDAWLNENPDSAQLYLAFQNLVASKILTAEDLAVVVLDSRIEARPIHHAILLIDQAKNELAREVLEKAALESKFEQAIRLLLLLPANITPESSGEDDHKYIHFWLDTHLREVEKLCEEISGVGLLTVYSTLVPVLGLLKAIGIQREQELLYVQERARERIVLEKKNEPHLGPLLLELEKHVERFGQ